MSDLFLDVKVRTVEGDVRGGERACGVSLRQIIATAYQAVTAAVVEEQISVVRERMASSGE